MLAGSTGEPDASTISALVGSRRTVPSGKMTSGSPPSPPALGDEDAPVVRVGERERVRHRAAPEELPQLVGPARPRLADDVDRVRRHALRFRPLEEPSRDRVVEELVGWRRRPEHVVVDPAVGRSSRRSRSPSPGRPSRPTRSAAHAWRAGGDGARPSRSSLPVIPSSHWPASTRATSSSSAASCSSRASASCGDRVHSIAVVAAVAVAQRLLDVAQCIRVAVDRERAPGRTSAHCTAVLHRRSCAS